MKPTIVKKVSSLDEYTYFYITPTQEITSNYGGTVSGVYYSSSKTINPSDIIVGSLMKKGYLRLPELDKNKLEKTFIVNYGESGRRNVNLGYSIEITLQFVSALNHTLICTATAEGQGSTEADDIRIALNKALEAILKE